MKGIQSKAVGMNTFNLPKIVNIKKYEKVCKTSLNNMNFGTGFKEIHHFKTIFILKIS